MAFMEFLEHCYRESLVNYQSDPEFRDGANKMTALMQKELTQESPLCISLESGETEFLKDESPFTVEYVPGGALLNKNNCLFFIPEEHPWHGLLPSLRMETPSR